MAAKSTVTAVTPATPSIAFFTVIGQVAQLFKIGPQILQLAVAAKYWADSPDNGPEEWGLRVQLTFLFPK